MTYEKGSQKHLDVLLLHIMSICFRAARLEGNTWVDVYPINSLFRCELDVSNANAFHIQRDALGVDPDYTGSVCPRETMKLLRELDTEVLRKNVADERPDRGTLYVLKLIWICRQAISFEAQLTWA